MTFPLIVEFFELPNILSGFLLHWTFFGSVISLDGTSIALTYAALMGLNVCACDIQHAYLQSPSSEKHYIICRPEFGIENIGKRAKIVRALYGGKSAGADYWRHVRKAMSELGFRSCLADPDVWLHVAQKNDGTEYYQYVLRYTDDILASIMENAEDFIGNELARVFVIKPASIGLPTQYLGNKVSKVTLENGNEAWCFSSSQYIRTLSRTFKITSLVKGDPCQPRSNPLGLLTTVLKLIQCPSSVPKMLLIINL